MTITKIKKWGNSYGIRILKKNMEELGIFPNDAVEVHIDSGHLTITPIKITKYNLDELLEKITSENLHGEIQTGNAVGAEEW